MAFVVVYDANVLYGNTLRDLLIRIAQSGTVQAKWTNAILDEIHRNLAANRPDITPEKLGRLRHLMNAAVPDCRIVWACVQQIVDSRVNPPETVEDVLDALERAGLVESVAALRTPQDT
jgi:hypothetical protein